MPKINHRLNRRVRNWTPQQKLERSQEKRKEAADYKDTSRGRKHYGLVFHFRGANAYEWKLAYEAKLNGTTTEEWIHRHRTGEGLTNQEVYLPPNYYVVCLDKNSFNCSMNNLYCFTTKKARLAFNKDRAKIIPNESQIYDECVRWTSLRRKAQSA